MHLAKWEGGEREMNANEINSNGIKKLYFDLYYYYLL